MTESLQDTLQALSTALDDLQHNRRLWSAVVKGFGANWERAGQRSMVTALADLRVQYKKTPTRALARMVAQLEAELEDRKRPLKPR